LLFVPFGFFFGDVFVEAFDPLLDFLSLPFCDVSTFDVGTWDGTEEARYDNL